MTTRRRKYRLANGEYSQVKLTDYEQISPPLIFTYVKTSEKHRHSQALLAMSVFTFCRQDEVGKTSFSGFCQVRSRQKECPVTDFKARASAFYFG